MIIINAHINQVSDFDDFQNDLLLNEIRVVGADDFISVNEVQDLLHALETNRHQQILLFTNFSPNKFYKKNGIDVGEFRIEPLKNWRVPEYSFSAALYHHICKEYSLVGIHFITSALKRNVNDCDFFNITNGIRTTIKRKRDWMKSDIDYNVLMKNYILDKIRESISSTSIIKPNHEILFRKPLVKFCQN